MKVAMLAAVSLVALDARDTDACTCGVQYVVSPMDQATDVPTNIVLQAVVDAEPLIELRVAATGEVVPLEIEISPSPGPRWMFARPSALAPSTSYVVELAGAFPTSTTNFTTGVTTHATPPTVELRSFAPQFLVNDTNMASSCLDIEVSRFEIDLDATDFTFAVLEFLAADRTTSLGEYFLDKLDLERAVITPSSCSSRPPNFTPGTEYCARARVYDVSGQVATSDVVCGVATECQWVWDSSIAAPQAACLPVDDDPQSPAAEAKGCASTTPALWVGGLALLLRRRRRLR